MPSYATAARIRQLEPEVFEDTEQFPDDTLRDWAEFFGDPEIDGVLIATGYDDAPFSQPPEIVQMISAMLGCAYGLQGSTVRYTSRNVERAETLKEQARDLLGKIRKGELSLPGFSIAAAGTKINYQSTGEDMHTNSVFVGDVQKWKMPTETRASS